MLRRAMFLAIVAVALAAASAPGATFHGEDDGRILRNPGCGLAFYYYSNSPDVYGSSIAPCDDMSWFPGCSICYLRLPWSMVEPEEGVFDWATIDAPAQRWIAPRWMRRRASRSVPASTATVVPCAAMCISLSPSS